MSLRTIILLCAVSSLFVPTLPAGANPALKIIESRLMHDVGSAYIQVEIIARRPAVFLFVRLRCLVLDASNASQGTFERDFGSTTGRYRVVIPTDYYWRPRIQLPTIENADHVTCKFATDSDPPPEVNPNDFDAQVVSTHTVAVTNLSPYMIASKTLECQRRDSNGQNFTATMVMSNAFGIGHPPGYRAIGEIGNPDFQGVTSCRITAAQAMAPGTGD